MVANLPSAFLKGSADEIRGNALEVKLLALKTNNEHRKHLGLL